MDQTLSQPLSQLVISDQTVYDSLNNEVIWGSNKDLFGIYVKNIFLTDRYRMSLINLPDDLDFDTAIYVVKFL